MCEKLLADPKDPDAVGCDQCGSWFHSLCISITRSDLKCLQETKALLWHCDECKSGNLNNSSSSSGTVIAQPVIDTFLNHKLDSILEALAANQARFTVIEEYIGGRDDKINELAAQCESNDAKINEVDEKFSAEVAVLRERINEVVTTASVVEAQCNTCSLTEARIEKIERQSLMLNLVLDGLPNVTEQDGREDLPAVVIGIAAIVKVTINREDIYKCYRIPSKAGASSTRCAPVIVHFRDQAPRDRLYFSYLKKRDLKLSDLLPDHSINSRIYLSENITAECKILFRRCAALKKKKLLFRYFTRNCRLYYVLSPKDSPVLATPQLITELEKQEGSS